MPSAPSLRPLITVIGATGTGKSQLAVDLARSLNGEIINADVMQMYEGLPIITNKMALQDRQGVPHHFLGMVPRDQEIRIGQWESGVRSLIEEMRGRGKLPIIVGGTHYYIQALLFPRSLLPEMTSSGGEQSKECDREELARKYPILNASTSQILAKLKEVDPVMADRWHPNDHRKIRRSLEIYYLHGCTPASEVYRRQQQLSAKKQTEKKEEWTATNKGNKAGWFRNLVFWVHSEPEVLNDRLGKRVEAMVSQGLFGEIFELWEYYKSLGAEVDLERGVWQSIGFKEFLPWLQARKKFGLDEDMPSKAGARAGTEPGAVDVQEEEEGVGERLECLRKEGLEKMRVATIQYARTQVKWIRIKLMNAVKEANEDDQEEAEAEVSGFVWGESGIAGGELTGAKGKTKGNATDYDAVSAPAPAPDLNSTTTFQQKSCTQPSNILYLLDSSDASKFTETVSNPAISIAKSFLCPPSTTTNHLPDPLSLSNLAASCLKPRRNYDLSKRPDLWVKRTCEICGVTTVDEDSWSKHEASARHRRMFRGRAKWEEGRRWKERKEQEVGGQEKVEEVGGQEKGGQEKGGQEKGGQEKSLDRDRSRKRVKSC